MSPVVAVLVRSVTGEVGGVRGGLWPTFFDWLHTDCSYAREVGLNSLAVRRRVIWNTQLLLRRHPDS